MQKLFPVFLLLLFVSSSVLGEGTKELRPKESNKGNLLLLSLYSPFGLYGAPEENQIKIRVASTSETIYFGLNNRNGIPQDTGAFVPNVPFRIVSPSGIIVYSSVMPDSGLQGHINTWTEAVNGPKQLGNPAGYDAIQIKPAETGDYVIEFNPDILDALELNGEYRLDIHLFDITVAMGNTPIPGRVHCKGWQMSTETFQYSFFGTLYPYDGSSAVYKVDFNGMQPLVFIVNFNSYGTMNTGNFQQDRKSRIGYYASPEYDIFLSPPDPNVFPVQKKNVEFSLSMDQQNCTISDFCLNFSTNSSGYLEGFLDFNNNGTYNPDSGEFYFGKYMQTAGNTCIPWNGKDTYGRLVKPGNINIISRFAFGVTHLPLYDVENNINGFKVRTVRPVAGKTPLLFWDDEYITAGIALDNKVELNGCNSVYQGCHRWEDRGAIFTGIIADQETINTWWYSDMVYDTLVYHIRAQKVNLSFDSVGLVQGDTTLCKGDSLNIYVYNDGDHFDSSRYHYNWYFNNQTLIPDIRSQKEVIDSASYIVVRASDKTDSTCISYDTLNINVVDPVKIAATVVNDTCDKDQGYISVTLLDGPPNTRFYWQEFPDDTTGKVRELTAGNFHLVVKDSKYSGRCALDTAFTVTKGVGVYYDSLSETVTACYLSNGKAKAIMRNEMNAYLYNWDSTTFSSNDAKSGLGIGLHYLTVKDPVTGCTRDTAFNILSLPFKPLVTSNGEICHNHTGKIAISLPSGNFVVSWNGMAGHDSGKNNLSEGVYDVSVSSPIYTFCSFDTSVTVTNTDTKFQADFTYKASVNIDSALEVYFENLSDTGLYYHWSFGDGDSSEIYSPKHSYSQYQDYLATLLVNDSFGCRDTVRKKIQLKEQALCGVALPNAFSPNKDQINNTLGVLGSAPFLDLKVFNRWGEVIFRAEEIKMRWDGTYRGQDCPEGVYPFVLNWKCPDRNGNLVSYQKVGDVTIVR